MGGTLGVPTGGGRGAYPRAPVGIPPGTPPGYPDPVPCGTRHSSPAVRCGTFPDATLSSCQVQMLRCQVVRLSVRGLVHPGRIDAANGVRRGMTRVRSRSARPGWSRQVAALGGFSAVPLRSAAFLPGGPPGGSPQEPPGDPPGIPRGVSRGDPQRDSSGDPPGGPPEDPPEDFPGRPPGGSPRRILLQDPPEDPSEDPAGEKLHFLSFGFNESTLKPC